MPAASDISKWVDVNRKVYKQSIKSFMNSEAYKHFSKAPSTPHIRGFGPMVRSWKGRYGILADKQWGIETVTDQDLDIANMIISKDFFNKVASQTASGPTLAQMKDHVDKGIQYVEIAKEFYDKVDKFIGISDWRAEGALKVSELLAIGGFTMIMMALEPYHLYVGFAHNSYYDGEKRTQKSQVIEDAYTFFTDPQWVPLMKYTTQTVRDNKIPALLDSIARTGRPNGDYIDQCQGAQELLLVIDKLANVKNFNTLLRVLGTNANKLFIDTYMPA